MAARHGVARLAVTATHAAMHVEVPDAPIVGLGRLGVGRGRRLAEVLGSAVAALREYGWWPAGGWVLMCRAPGVLVLELEVSDGAVRGSAYRRRVGGRRGPAGR